MGAFFEYLSALWQHWVWFMTGGPFVAERIAKQIWPGYDAWASRYLSTEMRQRLIVGAAILGIFVASFFAFNDERTLAIAANQAGQAHTPEADAVTASGSDQKTATPITAIYTVVLPSPERSGIILQPSGRRPLTVRNSGTKTLLVYPPIGAEINDLGINIPAALPYEDTFICISSVKCSG